MTTYANAMLTDADLRELTGRVRPASQRKWLDDAQIVYIVRPDGKPRTTWAAVDAALGLEPPTQ